MKKLGTLTRWSLTLSLALALIGPHQQPCSAAGPNDVDSLFARLQGITPPENQKIYNWEFWMIAEADPHPMAAGPVNVRFSFSPNLDCGPTTISIGYIDNLEYNGPESWVVQAAPADTMTYNLEMIIPPDDTSGLRITAESGKFRSYIHAYFVPRGDTFQFHNINPHQVTGGSRERIRERAGRKSIRQNEYPSEPQTAAGPNDVDSLILRIAGPPRPPRDLNLPFWMVSEANPHPTAAGPVNVRFSFSPNVDCGPTTISIGYIDNLEYSGPESWVVQAAPADTLTYDLKMVIPPDDTSGLRISAECGNFKYYVHAYFVPRGDTIQYHNINPHWVTGGSRERIRERAGRKSFRQDEDLRKPVPMIERTGRYLEDGTFIPSAPAKYYLRDETGEYVEVSPESLGIEVDSTEWRTSEIPNTAIQQRDTNLVWTTDGAGGRILVDKQELLERAAQEKTLRRWEKMRQLEQTPLTESDNQTFIIGDRAFYREKGEYEFTEAPVVQDRLAYLKNRHQRDMGDDSPGKAYERILDLRDPKDYEFATGVVDSLISTDHKGFFRVLLKKESLDHLRRNGIIAWKSIEKARQSDRAKRSPKHSPSSDGNAVDRETESDGSSDLLFAEYFDGFFPDIFWIVGDTAGPWDDYWGQVNCRTYGGSNYSVWCSAIGSMPQCEYYAYEMFAYMDLAAPIDISAHINIQASFAIWYETAPGDPLPEDMCILWYSEDGVNWYWGGTYDGTSNDWEMKSSNFDADDWDWLIISFVFYSEFDSNVEEGVYIDYLEITGTPRPLPNLTYGTPPGWSGPIVPSSVSGTNWTDTLYTGVLTYIDFSVYNVGSATLSQNFRTELFIDDQHLADGWSNYLPPGDWQGFEDNTYTVNTPGDHVLKIIIDRDSSVVESDETDNIFVDTFTWVEPPLLLPNLTYGTPPGWDSPIVASRYPGTHDNTLVFAGVPTYIDLSSLNDGNAAAGAFITYLYIDNVPVQAFVCAGLRRDRQDPVDLVYGT